MSTTSSTTSALPPPSTNTTVVVAATSSSSNPSSSSTSTGGGSTGGGGGGVTTTTLNVSNVPLSQNLLTAIQLKQIGEGLNTSSNLTEVDKIGALKKISSITTATPIVTSASSIQPIANLINTQHASLVKSKIMVCHLSFNLFLFLFNTDLGPGIFIDFEKLSFLQD